MNDNKKPTLMESLKRNFFPEKDIGNPNYSVSIYHPTRKEINFSVEDSRAGGINFDMFGMDAETGLTGDRLIRRWRQLAMHPIPQECIEEIINDAVVLEQEVVKLDTAKLADVYGEEKAEQVEESFIKIKELLEFEEKADILFTQFFIDGILPFEIIYDNKKMTEGIARIDQLAPFSLRKIYQVDQKRFVWRYNMSEGEEYRNNVNNMDLLIPAEERFSNTEELEEEQIVVVNSGIWDSSKMMYISPIYYAMRSINQLHLIEDNLIMYRLTHSADSRVFHIDCGKMTKDKSEAYVARLKRLYEQKKYYNTSTGEIDDQKQVRVIGENFWFPKNSDGVGSSVEMLSGGNMDLGELNDLDHFIKQVYGAFGIPKSRRRSAEESAEVKWSSSSDPNILREELNFSKKVRNYRRNFEKIFFECIKRDMIAKKQLTMQDWYKIKNKLEFIWESDNYYNTMKEFYIIDQKLGILERIEPFIESGYFTKEWVVRNVLKFTREEWDDMQKERQTYRMKDIDYAKDTEPGEGGGDFGGGGGGSDMDMGGDEFGGENIEGGGDFGGGGGGSSGGEMGDFGEMGAEEGGDVGEMGAEEGGDVGEMGAEEGGEDFNDKELVKDTSKKGENATYIKDDISKLIDVKKLIKEYNLKENNRVKVNNKVYVVQNNKLILE